MNLGDPGPTLIVYAILIGAVCAAVGFAIGKLI